MSKTPSAYRVKDVNRQITKEIQMDNTHIEKYSTSYVIKEMQIKQVSIFLLSN